ncbi:proline-rich protein 36-like [Macrobrachium rosenbergii]|uniref:proline-rich protein 36-like n=1 Tax=Macrobrachium rosenbergii TaxID=79674 RepID=UPI0034D481C8
MPPLNIKVNTPTVALASPDPQSLVPLPPKGLYHVAPPTRVATRRRVTAAFEVSVTVSLIRRDRQAASPRRLTSSWDRLPVPARNPRQSRGHIPRIIQRARCPPFSLQPRLAPGYQKGVHQSPPVPPECNVQAPRRFDPIPVPALPRVLPVPGPQSNLLQEMPKFLPGATCMRAGPSLKSSTSRRAQETSDNLTLLVPTPERYTPISIHGIQLGPLFPRPGTATSVGRRDRISPTTAETHLQVRPRNPVPELVAPAAHEPLTPPRPPPLCLSPSPASICKSGFCHISGR